MKLLAHPPHFIRNHAHRHHHSFHRQQLHQPLKPGMHAQVVGDVNYENVWSARLRMRKNILKKTAILVVSNDPAQVDSPTSSFLHSSYLLNSSVNISTCLSALVSSYTKRIRYGHIFHSMSRDLGKIWVRRFSS